MQLSGRDHPPSPPAADPAAPGLARLYFLGLAGLFTVTANNNGPIGAAINALIAAQGLWIIAASLTLPLRRPRAAGSPARP